MRYLLTLFLLITSINAQTQQVFTRADTLRGMLTPPRSCYDVNFYHLDIKIDTLKKAISGSNTIVFNATRDFDLMQVDLFANMNVDKILLDGKQSTAYTREFGAVFVKLPTTVKKGTKHELNFYYSGSPQTAERPPWDGGFTWGHDKQGTLWLVVTCQGTGASIWWPNKDHQSDEPDSMLISISVPPGLEDVSNGQLRKKTSLADGWTKYDWFVSYPINNYDVTINVGKYAHFSDIYKGKEGEFPLNFYVLRENLEKAKVQFQQVKPMLKCYEKYFGGYPFPKDGYKLVDSPHPGMEHQEAVAYGNWYIQGYRGRTWAPVGLKFDFIIVHESAHEWWGNSLTSADIADMWIHESFGAYAEALYIECMWGRKESLEYINGKKSNVRNDRPIIGIYNVQKKGADDMYDKGQLVLNTLRSVIDNDEQWFSIVKGLATTYRRSIVTADTIFNYINRKTGKDYNYFFEQYFRHKELPNLQIFITQKGKEINVRYRWVTEVKDFRMPVKVTTAPGKYEFINPTTEWKTQKLDLNDPKDFQVAEDLFLINVHTAISYLDPNMPEMQGRR